MRAALAEAGCGLEQMDYRLTDISGEQYYFKEASLTLSRNLRVLKPKFDLWHPADCIGECGAAIGPALLAVPWPLRARATATGRTCSATWATMPANAPPRCSAIDG